MPIIALVTSLAFVVTHVKLRRVSVPRELVGTWRADDVTYADHVFEIGLVTVTYGTGPGSVSVGFVQDIRAEAQDGKTLYTISYSVDDTEQQVSFYYDAGGDHTIRFKNQQQIAWKKDDGS